MRYRARLNQGVNIEDAKLEIEVCGGSDLDVDTGNNSVTFIADVDDIPAIRAMSTVEGVEELSESVEDALRH